MARKFSSSHFSAFRQYEVRAFFHDNLGIISCFLYHLQCSVDLLHVEIFASGQGLGFFLQCLSSFLRFFDKGFQILKKRKCPFLRHLPLFLKFLLLFFHLPLLLLDELDALHGLANALLGLLQHPVSLGATVVKLYTQNLCKLLAQHIQCVHRGRAHLLDDPSDSKSCTLFFTFLRHVRLTACLFLYPSTIRLFKLPAILFQLLALQLLCVNTRVPLRLLLLLLHLSLVQWLLLLLLLLLLLAVLLLLVRLCPRRPLLLLSGHLARLRLCRLLCRLLCPRNHKGCVSWPVVWHLPARLWRCNGGLAGVVSPDLITANLWSEPPAAKVWTITLVPKIQHHVKAIDLCILFVCRPSMVLCGMSVSSTDNSSHRGVLAAGD
mmetsp:Transcript_8238/g.15402  ORF Transcript_8238/g.15402 Transcript_8238/m.15402 type:complete len:378 (+) Transcript_8238:2026-3159(+)